MASPTEPRADESRDEIQSWVSVSGGILEWKLGAGSARKKKLRRGSLPRSLASKIPISSPQLPSFIPIHLPIPTSPALKMSGTEAANPPGIITSSADRMVGAEHAEVRYFTRYDFLDFILALYWQKDTN